jgi:hypothetical protein
VDDSEFVRLRNWLGKTQEQLCRLLGTSVRAVRSYEQGWRPVPVYVERQMLFLLSRHRAAPKPTKKCWDMHECPVEIRKQCPAWEFRAGELCWFIAGTHCQGSVQTDWSEKMRLCRQCEMLRPLLKLGETEGGRKSAKKTRKKKPRATQTST